MKRGKRFFWALAIFVGVIQSLWGAENPSTTDADRSYLELRKSKDRASQLLAERWTSVTGLQEWTDVTGEHKTTAKYVDHDPGLQWVKLRVIQGTGEKRVVKDVQVPLEKLSKTSQARVKQIATLKDKVAAAIAADKEKEKEGKEPGAAGEAARAMPEQNGERMTAEGAPRGELRGSSEVAPTEQAPTTEGPASTAPSPDGPPALRMPTESNAMPTASVEAAPQNSSLPTDPQSENGEPWRTSYEAFRSKISMEVNRSGLMRVNWGPIPALQAAYDQLMQFESTGSVSAEQGQAVSKMLDDIGDFTWEATLTDQPVVENDWTGRIGLPPLPEPIHVGFILDQTRDPGPWQNLNPGDHVRFIGRFGIFDDEASLAVLIRFPADQSSPSGAPPAEERR